MTHWLIAPVVLPAMLAPFIVLAARYHVGIQRVFSLVGVIALTGIGSRFSTVLLALAIWSALWGMTGAILAVPLTAMVMIILAEIPNARWIAVMMSEKGDL